MNLLKCNDKPVINDLLSAFTTQGFKPTITKPTRIQNQSATLIDNLYLKTRKPSPTQSVILLTDISDHFPVLIFKSNYLLPVSDAPTSLPPTRTINNRVLPLILDDLHSTNWNILQNNTLDAAYDNFMAAIATTLDRHAPLRNRPRRKRATPTPWITDEIRSLAKQKQTMYKKSLRLDQNHPYKQQYITIKNTMNRLRNTAKRTYYYNKLATEVHDMKATWQTINEVIGKPRRKETQINRLIIDNKEITDTQHIANELNHFFAHVGEKQSNEMQANNIEHYTNFMHTTHPNSIYLTPTTEEEIHTITMRMKSKRSTGHDDMSTQHLKQILPGILYPLQILFNRSIDEGIFPQKLKHAKIKPLHKKNEKDQMTNYRPISLLPAISKILEKLIHKRLYSFLTSQHIISDRQYGFRPKLSTSDALCTFLSDTYTHLNSQHFTTAAFLDLSKAFDTIKHSILFHKLHNYGIRGASLNLIKSYLTNRTQYCVISNIHSNTIQLPPYGVPQGSVLGPLFYLIYTNDICNAISHASLIQFADDTTLYCSGPNLTDLRTNITSDLTRLVSYFSSNSLQLNLSKTNYMIIKPKASTTNIGTQITINNTDILRVNETKFLGVIIDDKLSFQQHIKQTENKISKGLYALRTIKNILPKKHLKLIYHALISPHLSYGIPFWHNSTKQRLHRLTILQKKAIRIITNSQYNAPSSPLFKQERILPLEKLHQAELQKLMYRIHHSLIPNPIPSAFSFNPPAHPYPTRYRNTNPMTTQINRHHLSHKSFVHHAPLLWNTLSPDLKNSSSLKQFNKKIKTTLLGLL